MDYADQTSGAIRLYLTEGNFDLEQLTILKKESLQCGEFVVDFGILGASHFVQFRYGKEVLSEVCACTEAIVPDNAKLLENDFLPNLHSVPLLVQFLIFQYSFNFTYVNWQEGGKRLTLLRNSSMKSNNSIGVLDYTFPKLNDSDEHPVTEVYVSFNSDIEVHTVHTYPNEDMMVFTESILKL
jgi:hypothetical protein